MYWISRNNVFLLPWSKPHKKKHIWNYALLKNTTSPSIFRAQLNPWEKFTIIFSHPQGCWHSSSVKGCWSQASNRWKQTPRNLKRQKTILLGKVEKEPAQQKEHWKKTKVKNRSLRKYFNSSLADFCSYVFLLVPSSSRCVPLWFHLLLSSFSNLSLLGGWATHLENINQIGSFFQAKVKMQNLWNYHWHCHSSKLGLRRSLGAFFGNWCGFPSYFTPYPASKKTFANHQRHTWKNMQVKMLESFTSPPPPPCFQNKNSKKWLKPPCGTSGAHLQGRQQEIHQGLPGLTWSNGNKNPYLTFHYIYCIPGTPKGC